MATAYHDRGFKGREATPSHFEFYGPDGGLLRDEMGWPSLEIVRWYRPGGEQTTAYVEAGTIQENGAWRTRAWSWYDRRGEVVRQEEDSNGDGIPDVQGKSNEFSQKPHTPQSIDRSWAVNPALIPEDLRYPGQPDRRVPLRRIPE